MCAVFSGKHQKEPNEDAVKIDLQDVTETRKTLAVTFEASEVQAEEASLLRQFASQAKIPGFRPGKAPQAVVRKRFAKQIGDELRQRVVSKAYQDGTKEAKVDLIHVVDLDRGDIASGAEAKVTFTVDVRPAFEIKDYKGIQVTQLPVEVADAEIDEFIKGIRSERADFEAVERPAGKGDYVKFSHEGTIDGQPISEIAPDKPVYAKMPQTWEEVGSEQGLIPGLAAALEGASKGDKREVEVLFPADFTVEALQGKAAKYAVDVQEVRARKLPELDEEFFKAQGVKDLADLKERVSTHVKAQKEQQRRADIRAQVTERIASMVNIPLPESLVERETESAMRQVVSRNMRKGITQDQLEQNKEEIHARSAAAAREAVKLQLILSQIAEKESIVVGDEDFRRYIINRAYQSGEKPEAIAKELRKNQDHLRTIRDSLLYDKTLEFLVDQATVSADSKAEA